MGSGLGLGERRWGLSSAAWKAATTQTVTGIRTGEPPGGLVRALCLVTGPPGPGTSSRERPGVAEEGKTISGRT